MLGCASSFRTEAEGGLPWREYETQHFVLRTDAEPQNALETARHLEDVFFVLSHVAFPYKPHFEGQTEVVLFSNEDDLGLLGRETAGLHRSGHTWLQTMPTIVIAGENDAGSQIVAHELVHQFVGFHMPQAPLWLNEGLAMYYETMRVEDGSLTIGEHLLAQRPLAYFRMQPEELLPATALHALDRSEFYEKEKRFGNYMSAWTLVSALQMGARKPSFSAYLDALQSGRVSEKQAFREHCQRWLDESLERDRGAVLEKRVTEIASFRKFQRPARPVSTSKALRPADVHVLWARLLEHRPEESLREAERALELEPGHPEATLVLAAVDPHADGQLISKRLWAAYEESNRAPRYGAILLRAKKVDDPIRQRRLDEVARLLIREARTSLEFEALGAYLFATGRPGTAEKYADLAARRDPSNRRAYQLLARIAASEGDYAHAFHFQTWSIHLRPHEPEPEELRLLEEYERKLRESPQRASEQ